MILSKGCYETGLQKTTLFIPILTLFAQLVKRAVKRNDSWSEKYNK